MGKMLQAKAVTHTLCEPAQSKCTWTARKKHFLREIRENMSQNKTRDHTMCELAQWLCTWTCHKSHFIRKFTGKMPGPMIAAHTVCEPAQSKCTWTFHKSRFVCRKNVADQPEHPDQALAFRLTVRTLQSKHTVCGRTHFACIFTGFHALAALLAGCCNFVRHGASYRRIIAMSAKEPNIPYKYSLSFISCIV